MKKLLLFIICISFFLVSCSLETEGRILKKLEKHLDKYTGYKTQLQMKIVMDDKESEYKMKESYTLGNKYKLEVLEPSESKGMTIEYDGEKIYLKHSTLKQSISIDHVKNFDQGLLIGKFFRDPYSIKSVEEEEIDGVKYYVFYNKVTDKNKYNNKQIIWLKKKDFKPYMLNIIDEDDNPRVIIKYSDFVFTKD